MPDLSGNNKPPKKPLIFKAVEERQGWRDHPEFRWTQSMRNECQPNFIAGLRYLKRNILFAQEFDKGLAERLEVASKQMEDLWNSLVEYQDNTLKPLYNELFPGKDANVGEDIEEIEPDLGLDS